MAITISGNGITTNEILDGTITTDDILASDVTSLKSGRKNLIINGAMQVAQRGTSANLSTSGFVATDRIYQTFSSLGAWTIEQSTDAPEGFSNSHKMTCTTADASPAAGDYARWIYKIEGQDLQQLAYGTSEAKTITFSCWVKSNKTGSAVLNFRGKNTTQSRKTEHLLTINTADTWEKKTFTVAGDTSMGIEDTTDVEFELDIWLNGGSNWSTGSRSETWDTLATNRFYADGTLDLGEAVNDYFSITGVQLEVGDTATDFEHRSYGEELALCQRYYQIGAARLKIYPMYTTNGWITVMQDVNFKVTMRTSPSVTYGNESSGHSTDSVTNEYVRVKRYYNSHTNEKNIHTTLKADAEL